MSRPFRWLVVTTLAAGFSCSTALAQATPPLSPESTPAIGDEPARPSASSSSETPAAASRSGARGAYARGQALFTAGKYAEAKAAFDEAYALTPNPIVLLSSAECDIRLGNIEQAHALLQRYLNERPDAPDRAQVERKAAELSAKPALLMLTSEPRGAAIQLDGQTLGVHTPAEILVQPGEHRVALSHPGHETTSEIVRARMGARHGLRLILRVAQQPAAAAPKSPAPAPAADGGSHATLWISGILGGAGIATGTVLGVMALKEREHFNAMPTKRSADRGERLALFADVAFGVGAVALITAAVLYVTDDADHPDAAETARGLRLSPFTFSRGAGLAASGHF